VLISRYEDLLRDYQRESVRLADYLGLDVAGAEVQQVITHYRPEMAEGQEGTHFFKGRIGRFREVFSATQQSILVEKFGPFLAKMGYSP
jgi:hypothetical protein